MTIYPASHYVTPPDKMAVAIEEIERELAERIKYFELHDKLVWIPAHRGPNPLRHRNAKGDRHLLGRRKLPPEYWAEGPREAGRTRF